MTNMPHPATTTSTTSASTSSSSSTSTSCNNKRVRICLDSVRVYTMPQDNREEYLDRLFYSPIEIKGFQDEKFEEEAAALQVKKEKEAAQRKREKDFKKKQRKERLQARKQARLHKTNCTTTTTTNSADTSTPSAPSNTTTSDDNDSDCGLLSTSASSSSDSEEPAYPSLDAHSPQRQPTKRRVRNRKLPMPSTPATLSLDLSALPGANIDDCDSPSSVSTASTDFSTPPPASDSDSPTKSRQEFFAGDEVDIEAAVALLPKRLTEATPSTGSLQRELKRWKRSSLLLFGLLILSWLWFSFALLSHPSSS